MFRCSGMMILALSFGLSVGAVADVERSGDRLLIACQGWIGESWSPQSLRISVHETGNGSRVASVRLWNSTKHQRLRHSVNYPVVYMSAQDAFSPNEQAVMYGAFVHAANRDVFEMAILGAKDIATPEVELRFMVSDGTRAFRETLKCQYFDLQSTIR